MRSYETARSSFGILEFFAKALILVGLLAVIPALLALERQGAIALIGAVPGVAIVAMGFFGQAYAQTSRATVDSAEYAQQSLGLARDQFEISKQLLRLAQAPQTAATYTADAPSDTLNNISFDTDAQTSQSPTAAPLAKAAATPIEDSRDRDTTVDQMLEVPAVSKPKSLITADTKIDRMHRYSNTRIAESNGKFLIEDKSYDTLDEAKIAIDKAPQR